MGHIGGWAAAEGVSLVDKGADLVVALLAAALIAAFGAIAGKKGGTPGGTTANGNSGPVLQAGPNATGNRVYDNRLSITQNVTNNFRASSAQGDSDPWLPIVLAMIAALAVSLLFISFSNVAFGLLIGVAVGGTVIFVLALIRSIRLGVVRDPRIIRIIVFTVLQGVASAVIVKIGLHDTVWAGHRLLDYQTLASGVRGDGQNWSWEYPLNVARALGGIKLWLGAFFITAVFLAALLATFAAIVEVLQWQNMLRLRQGIGSDRAWARAENFATASWTTDLAGLVAPLLVAGVIWGVNAMHGGSLPFLGS